jgi:lipopolysaccharide transport protein LptA
MAASPLKTLIAAALSCAALPAQAAEKSACNQPYEINSSGASEFDFGTGKTTWHHVSISQCDVSISAELAVGNGDAKDSRWVFSGNVRIDAEQRGNMQSDRAEVEFRDNRLAKAVIKGNPAQFEQKQTAANQVVRGRAGEIVYDIGAGTVRFADNAWLTFGGREMTAPLFVYDIRRRTVQGEHVRATIMPKAAEASPRPHSSPQAGNTTQ